MLALARRFVALWLLAAVSGVLCLAQMLPSDAVNYRAKVISATGRVSVLRDSTEWALGAGDSVQVKQIILTGADGHAVFQVSDGSTFEVFPNSQVQFRKNPGNWGDLLDLLVGRIRVQIQRLGGQPNPNRIYTPAAVISVRGTVFDVAVDDDDEATLVEVEEGSVEVQHALMPRGSPKLVSAGESIRVYKNEPLQARSIDKGGLFRQILRMAYDTMQTIATQQGAGGVGLPGPIPGTGGLSGDTKGTPPPPPPPAPPTGGLPKPGK